MLYKSFVLYLPFQELRLAFDAEVPPAGKEKLVLTAAVGCGTEVIQRGYEIEKIAEYVHLTT